MNKKRTTLVVALVVMGIAVLGLAAAVYAKYVSTLTDKTGSLTVAKWAFTDDNRSTEFKCELGDTYTAATLVDGKIAPGTSGICEIELSNENSEVGVEYTVTVKNQSGPTNLVFTNATPLTGTLTPGETGKKVTINWAWPYETSGGDTDDTTDGEAAGDMSVTIDIYGEQVQPAVQP